MTPWKLLCSDSSTLIPSSRGMVVSFFTILAILQQRSMLSRARSSTCTLCNYVTLLTAIYSVHRAISMAKVIFLFVYYFWRALVHYLLSRLYQRDRSLVKRCTFWLRLVKKIFFAILKSGGMNWENLFLPTLFPTVLQKVVKWNWQENF